MARNTMTPEQQQWLQQAADYGKQLQELAFANSGKYVAAGYAGNTTEPSKLYCYCGEGNGFAGAPIMPAHAKAVVFATKAAAEAKASLLKYQTSKGERITLKAMPASEFFWLVFDETCKAMSAMEALAHDKL